jgi:DNA-binding NarL/FixJ family response regulator
LIADDHPLFRGALREAVNGLFDRVEVAEAGSFEQVVERLEFAGEVDLILLDLQMPGVRGFSGLMYLRAQYPSLPVAIVSANDDPARKRCAVPSRGCCREKRGRRPISRLPARRMPRPRR